MPHLHPPEGALTAEALVERLRGAVAPNVAVAVGSCVAGRTPDATLAGDAALYFDLASLTKSVTALAVLAAGMQVEAPLATYLPELAGTFGGGAVIGDLLAHRAGLSGHVPLFLPLLAGRPVDRAAAVREAAEARAVELPQAADGTFNVLYSDCGYVLLGAALARRVGVEDAGAAQRALVLTPLGIDGAIGTAADFGVNCKYAPTENVPFRGGILEGVVHDENAWALSGRGGSGHAGLFGTAGGVLAFALAVERARRGEPGPLSAEHVRYLLAARAGGVMRAGFDAKSPIGSSAGDLASPGTYGHLGFTGTSFWVCPRRGVATVLLTNRVCPTRENVAIRWARPFAHDALFAIADRARPVVHA